MRCPREDIAPVTHSNLVTVCHRTPEVDRAAMPGGFQLIEPLSSLWIEPNRAHSTRGDGTT